MQRLRGHGHSSAALAPPNAGRINGQGLRANGGII